MPPVRHISLSDLQKLIKKAIDVSMPLSYWITAEISEMKVNYSGHCYLELVEKGGNSRVPAAKANAVIWRSTYGAVASYFLSATGCELAQGMKVMLKVAVNYHELYGLSLVVSDIDPLYTVGDMERQRQLTISQLQDEGVFDMNRTLDLPPVPQRIAVVSSRNAAGYQDFMNELSASAYHFHVTLFDAFMQGAETENSVVGAMEDVMARAHEFDLVVVIRGGGSQSDLAAFDSYRLCCHLAQFPLPVFTGIGHDKDHSVADMVAAVSLKTPTAVASYLVECLAGFDSWLASACEDINRMAVEILDGEWRFIEASGNSLYRICSSFTHGLEMKLAALASDLSKHVEVASLREKARLEELGSAMERGVGIIMEKESSRLSYLSRIAGSKSPDNIMAMGFAMVRKNGKLLKNTEEIHSGDRVDILMRGVSFEAEVKTKYDGKK